MSKRHHARPAQLAPVDRVRQQRARQRQRALTVGGAGIGD
jgi:hypothetical protein